MYVLLPNCDRDSHLASTLTCAGLGGCCSGGGAREKCCSGGGAGERNESAWTAPDRNQGGSWIYHWLWRYMTSMIKINEWDVLMEMGIDCTCQGP